MKSTKSKFITHFPYLESVGGRGGPHLLRCTQGGSGHQNHIPLPRAHPLFTTTPLPYTHTTARAWKQECINFAPLLPWPSTCLENARGVRVQQCFGVNKRFYMGWLKMPCDLHYSNLPLCFIRNHSGFLHIRTALFPGAGELFFCAFFLRMSSVRIERMVERPKLYGQFHTWEKSPDSQVAEDLQCICNIG